MTSTELSDLRGQWHALLPDGAELSESLLDRWSQPHRHYHDLGHLRFVLDQVAVLAEPYHDQQLVGVAAWYHDAVYAIPAGEIGNEEASARLAEHELDAHLGPAQVREVGRLVRLTADHHVDANDADGALLCDADLAILGADEDGYRRYAAAIRAEYRHVPDEQFRRGRRSVLASLLAEDQLFRTRRGARLEPRARQNLTAEIGDLS